MSARSTSMAWRFWTTSKKIWNEPADVARTLTLTEVRSPFEMRFAASRKLPTAIMAGAKSRTFIDPSARDGPSNTMSTCAWELSLVMGRHYSASYQGAVKIQGSSRGDTCQKPRNRSKSSYGADSLGSRAGVRVIEEQPSRLRPTEPPRRRPARRAPWPSPLRRRRVRRRAPCPDPC